MSSMLDHEGAGVEPHGSILMPSFLSFFTNSAVRGHPKVTFLNIRAPSATS